MYKCFKSDLHSYTNKIVIERLIDRLIKCVL